MPVKPIAAAVFAAILSTGAALAHHGWSSYDASKTMTIKGPVVTSSFTNPHASITMKHEGADWTVILAPVSRMESRGATMDKVAAGREISATGYPLKSGEKEIRAEFVTIDGKDIQLR